MTVYICIVINIKYNPYRAAACHVRTENIFILAVYNTYNYTNHKVIHLSVLILIIF